MSIFSKVRGTIETIFQIGLGGPQVKNNAGVIEARDATDAGYVKVRGADPAAANDFVTKGYADTNYADGTGAVKEIRFVLDNTASQSSATSVPANAYVISAELKVTTPYSGGSTISIGRTGSTSLLQTTTDNLTTAANSYVVDQDTAFGGSALPVLVTVGGAPAAGAGVAIVRYTVPSV